MDQSLGNQGKKLGPTSYCTTRKLLLGHENMATTRYELFNARKEYEIQMKRAILLRARFTDLSRRAEKNCTKVEKINLLLPYSKTMTQSRTDTFGNLLIDMLYSLDEMKLMVRLGLLDLDPEKLRFFSKGFFEDGLDLVDYCITASRENINEFLCVLNG